jgi:multidrug transporter EmrE-like cation transporter
MWFLLMLVMLFTNGMSAFGLKIISTWGLPENTKFSYLTVWYAAGFACIALPMLVKRSAVGLKELGWGAVMAVLGIGGQVAMATALNMNVPGNIVFPVTSGGAILAVGVAGRVFFKERMNRLTTAGIVLGFLAVILLSVS